MSDSKIAILTYEKLAEVAQARRIHTWFEQAWAMTMNSSNPALCAIRAVNAKKEKGDRDLKLKTSGAICVISVLAAISIVVLYPYMSSMENNFSTAKSVAIAILITITGAFLGVELIFAAIYFIDVREKKIPEGNGAIASSFCVDLQVFIAGLDMDVDSWFNWSRCADMKTHKIMALTILARAAKQILLIQASISADEQEKKYDAMENARVIHKGRLTKELDEKYNALQRIGMVSGGYKKIFDKAAELIASEAAVKS